MAKGEATLRYIVKDILEDLNQKYPGADIKFTQVMYWVMLISDAIKRQHLQKEDSSYHVTSFLADVYVDLTNGRNYIELPKGIYDLDYDRGIHYISYKPEVDNDIPTFGSIQFNRTTIAKSRRLYWKDDEYPTSANPYFYRLGDRIYFLGVENINLRKVEIGLYLGFNPVDADIDIDAPFDMPNHLLYIVKRQILDMGRFVLAMPLFEGVDTKEVSNEIPQQKITSVNAERNAE